MNSRKGMFLPGILITSVVATMFIGAALALAPTGLFRAQLSSDQDAAERAAKAGVEYALARLASNPHWKGDAAGIDTPDLFVREERGNVVGLIRESDGNSRFRLRFNLQNGDPGNDIDGFSADPSAAMKFDFPLVSFNNLAGVDQTVPSDPGNGRPDPQLVRGHSVYFAVEGTAGRGLSNLSHTNPNEAIGGGYSKKVLRCAYQATQATPNVRDAVTMAADSFKATMPTGSSSQLTLSGDRIPTIRSKVSLSVDGNASTNVNFTSPKTGEYWVPTGATGDANFGPQTNISRKDEDVAKDGFYQIKWEDVPKAGTGADKLAAGTYVYSVDANGNGHLHYYDLSPKDYPAYIDANPTDVGTVPPNSAVSNWPIDLTTTPVSLSPGVQVSYDKNKGKAHFDVSKDVEIEAKTVANANQDFGVIPQKGAAIAPAGDPNAGSAGTFSFSGNGTSQVAAGPLRTALFLALGGNMSNIATCPTVDYCQPGVGSIIFDAQNGLLQVTLDANPDAAMLNSLLSAINQGSQSPQNAAIAASPLDPEDIEVALTPASGGKSLVLSNNGALTFGAQVDGTKASIVSGSEIKVIGAGTSITADKKSQGLSLYAKGDVTLSSFNPSNTSKAKAQHYNNVSLTGIVYTWGDFKAILGSQKLTNTNEWGSFALKGTLVAYGGDPAAAPGTNGKGKVDIVANGADLNFDSSYLLNLIEAPNYKMTRSWWSTR